jgi:hypothetical protein
MKPLSKKTLGVRLTDKGYATTKKRVYNERTGKTEMTTVRLGLSPKPPEEETQEET